MKAVKNAAVESKIENAAAAKKHLQALVEDVTEWMAEEQESAEVELLRGEMINKQHRAFSNYFD